MTNIAGKQELDWPNMAKAACIVLVVLMHCETYLPTVDWGFHGRIARGWEVVSDYFRPIRMPLFFLVSGLLASNSIMRPRPDTQRKRMLRPMYLYLLWGVIFQVLTPQWSEVTENMHWSQSTLVMISFLVVSCWYLAALAVYYLLAKFTLRMPVLALIGLCAAVSIFATFHEHDMAGHQAKLLRCALFFIVGVRMRDQVLAFVAEATPSRMVALAAVYLMGATVCVRYDTFLLPVDVVAVALGAIICQLAVRRYEPLKAASRWLAHRTLQIYLIHFLVLAALAAVYERLIVPGTPATFWMGVTLPLMWTPVAVAVSLVAHKLLLTLRLGWLFDLPWPSDAHEVRATA
jgi:peptidoglycan/LPS O-acetylase OafA/YrhL